MAGLFYRSLNAVTLDFILRSCYPIRSPKINGLHDLPKVLIAARKYQIEAFEGVTESGLEAAITDDPIGVYAISIRFGLGEIADKAARATVLQPLLTFSAPLSDISVDQYFRLLKYRDDCGIAAAAVAESRTWFEPCLNSLTNTSSCGSCYFPDKAMTNVYPPWSAPAFLWDFLARAGIGLRNRPFGSWLLLDREWEDMISRWGLVTCCHRGTVRSLSYGMDKFRKILADAVERAVDAVSVVAIALSQWVNADGRMASIGPPARTLRKERSVA